MRNRRKSTGTIIKEAARDALSAWWTHMLAFIGGLIIGFAIAMEVFHAQA